MTRKELHALMTGMLAIDDAMPKPMRNAELALEHLEAAEEVYAKSEGFRGTIEALEVAARRMLEWHREHPNLWAPRFEVGDSRILEVGELHEMMLELRDALDALEPSSG